MKKNHWESLQTMKTSDIYLDQFNIGTYGVAAIEALLMGKVVLAYIDPVFVQLYPACKIKSCKLDGLLDALKATLFDWEMYQKSEKDRVIWARTFHSPMSNAKYMLDIYCGKEPSRNPETFLKW